MPLRRGALARRDRHLAGRVLAASAAGIRLAREWGLARLRKHPRYVDGALAAALFWLSEPDFTDVRTAAQARSVALAVAVLLPLIWRRRAPFAVLLVMSAAAAVQLAFTVQVSDDAGLLAAFYTVAAYEKPARIAIAAGVLEAGAVPAAAQGAGSATRALWTWVLASGLIAAAGFTGWYVRSRRVHLELLAEHAERLERERDQQAQLAAGAERQRIAREMHDIVAHNIAVMIALAEGAARTASDSPQAVTLMGEVSATGRTALAEMRRLLGVLRQQPADGHAPQPSLADLDGLLASARAAGLAVRVTVTGDPAAVPPSAQLTVYRIVQESLTNTMKHAPGASARVRLAYQPGQIDVQVTDDGAAAGPPSGAGHGITGMRERAAVFGGHVEAGPGPDGGWRVHTLLTLDPVPAEATVIAGERGP